MISDEARKVLVRTEINSKKKKRQQQPEEEEEEKQ